MTNKKKTKEVELKEFKGLMIPKSMGTKGLNVISKFSFMAKIDRGNGAESFPVVKTDKGLVVCFPE